MAPRSTSPLRCSLRSAVSGPSAPCPSQEQGGTFVPSPTRSYLPVHDSSGSCSTSPVQPELSKAGATPPSIAVLLQKISHNTRVLSSVPPAWFPATTFLVRHPWFLSSHLPSSIVIPFSTKTFFCFHRSRWMTDSCAGTTLFFSLNGTPGHGCRAEPDRHCQQG